MSALSSALRVMMSSFPAHFRIFDILDENKEGKKKVDYDQKTEFFNCV